MEQRKFCLVPESNEKSVWPICNKNNLKQLRGHISQVHKGVSGVERRKLLKQVKKYSTCSTPYVEEKEVVSFMSFLMALQHLPIKMRLQNKMKHFENEYSDSWTTKSMKPLSKKAKMLAWKAYNTYKNGPKKWCINDGEGSISKSQVSS